ncbi:MAG: AAA domain-containing protein [Lachnospiraceae bacterium]
MEKTSYDEYNQNQELQKKNKSDSLDKVIALYKYIRDVTALRQKNVLNIKDYNWSCSLFDIPKDEENIKVFYRDRMDEDVIDFDRVLLRVHKPEFMPCPEPDEEIREWILDGWDAFENGITCYQAMKKNKNTGEILEKMEELEEPEELEEDTGIITLDLLLDEKSGSDNDKKKEKQEQAKEETEIIEFFLENSNRVNSYVTWIREREEWVKKQIVIDETRKFFTKLYQLHIELERDAQTLEMVISNGFLRDSERKEINYPILTRRVKTVFYAKENIICIEDTDVESEIYATALQEMDAINWNAVSMSIDDLEENDYHPLDRRNTPQFLQRFSHQLSAESLFSMEGETKNWKKENRFLVYWNPTFIVRKRVDGTRKAVEQIIQNLEDIREVPSHLSDIVSGGKIALLADKKEESLEEQLAAVGGESIDILLSKEANKEQLEIARRMELYNAVLVQGPPGTGKTHTIANLMGHFLAQGKTILVTSHTKKALNVLKDKVASGLEALCVSVLDDSNEDMEKSIDAITDYMSKYTSFELEQEKERVAIERKQVIDDLANVRKKIFKTIHEEYKEIVLDGEAIEVSKAAKFVAEHREDLSYIPGDIRMYSPFPVSFEELSSLYRSNEKLSYLDEKELLCELPRSSELISPVEFEKCFVRRREIERQLEELEIQREWKITRKDEGNQLCFETEFAGFCVELPSQENLDDLNEQMQKFGQIEEWMKYAAVDGRKGTTYKKRWERLIEQIKATCNLAENLVAEQFGKVIYFEHEDHKEEYIPILEKLREVFERKRKVSGLDLLFNRNFHIVLDEIKINGNKIQSDSDCNIVLNSIKVEKEREQCARYWNELFMLHQVPDFFSLDTLEPERIASKWIPEMEYYLSWYETDYSNLVQKMENANLPVDTIFNITTLDSELEEMNKILTAAKNIIPFISKACQLGIDMQKEERKLERNKFILQEKKRIGSEICRNLVEAIKEEDILKYTKNFVKLEEIYEKYSLKKEREEILAKIAKVAPKWAEAIEDREGIHGQSIVPSNIEDAWKWKQYAEIIAEIVNNPFRELQEESIMLSKKYREATAKYAEICAWYHLLRKTECDIDMKQALQGWKQTVKKIGKGTGKNAPRLKAKARKLMAKCQEAVPGWIMTMNRALESLDPRVNRFDVIIVDEASQSDLSSLAITYMARKLIIVGDDRQVSPMGIGIDIDKMTYLEQIYLSDVIPNSHLYNIKTSLYDIAATTFQSLMLREHFRCVPEIIGFSNKLSYDYKIKPLRDASSSNLFPAVVNYRVEDGERNGRLKENTEEANHIVALLMACMEQPEYEGKTFGVISLLGDLQAKKIQSLIFKHIDTKEIEKRKLLCGNASNFQGDERDVIFLSMVDSRQEEGPLSLQGYGVEDSMRKRYNVATSRARDQLWVVNSLDASNDLKPGDIRKTLLDYATNPEAFLQVVDKIEKRAESPFEEEVAKALAARGYHIEQQWSVGAYRLDIVAIYRERKIAIECDGERYHSSEAKIRADMERQTILERIGWRFIRIRGSEFFSDMEQTMNHVCEQLEKYGIYPENVEAEKEISNESRQTPLLNRVKIRALEILKEFQEKAEVDLTTIRFALEEKQF